MTRASLEERVGCPVRTFYDEEGTPYRRVLASDVAEAQKGHLGEIYRMPNPVALRRRIEENLEKLWRLDE